MKKTKTSKITLFEALLIYIMMLYSPFIRFATGNSISEAKQASWLVFIFSLVIYIPLLYILCKITKKFGGKSLHDIFCRVFGKPIGKIICVLFILWMFVLLSLYLKYTAEKIVTSSFVGTDIELIMFLVVAIVGVMLRWGLKVLSRMNKVIYALTLIQFIILITLLMWNFNIKNVTPISRLDIEPVLTSIIYPLTVTAYITPMFIFNDQIQYEKKNLGKFAYTAIFLTVAETLIVLSILGMFGHNLAAKLTFPLLTAVENITIMGATAGLDSLFIAIWMIAEYITISFFAYGTVRLIKSLFNLKNEVPVLTAVLGFAFFLSIYLNNNIFELIVFSKKIATVANISLFIGVPFVLFVVAKIRKLV